MCKVDQTCSENMTKITTHIDNTSVFSSAIGGDEAADGEARVAVLLTIFHIITPCHRHVVDDPEKVNLNYLKKFLHTERYHTLK